MRRLILTIPILAAISLIGALLSAPATAQGDPVPNYESTVVATDDIGSRSVLSSEAQSGASPQVHSSVAKAQGSEDKPIYAELIERVVEFGQQILKRATDIAPPAFTRLDWKLKTASILMAFVLLAGIYQKLKERAWPKINYPTLNAPVTQPPSDLPAAAISVLGSRKVSLETFLAALIEMCQKDILQVVGIRVTPRQTTEGESYDGEYEYNYRGKYIYWLVPKGAPQFEWERIVLNLIPKQPMMIDALIDRQDEALLELPKFPDDLPVGPRGALIGRQLGELCDTEGFSTITLCRRCQTRIGGRLLFFWGLFRSASGLVCCLIGCCPLGCLGLSGRILPAALSAESSSVPSTSLPSLRWWLSHRG